MSDYSSISYILGGLGIFALFLVIIVLALYLVSSIGTMKVLRFYNHKNTWMAFIPIVSTIALVQCMKADENGNISMFGMNIEKKWFMWFPVIQILLGYVPAVGSLLSLVVGIVCLAITYKDLLTRTGSNEDITVLAWLSSIISIVWVVLCYTKFKGTVHEEVISSKTSN